MIEDKNRSIVCRYVTVPASTINVIANPSPVLFQFFRFINLRAATANRFRGASPHEYQRSGGRDKPPVNRSSVTGLAGSHTISTAKVRSDRRNIERMLAPDSDAPAATATATAGSSRAADGREHRRFVSLETARAQVDGAAGAPA